MSGEKKWNKTHAQLTAVSTVQVRSRFSTVHRLSVGVTISRSWTRKDYIHILPDFITPQRGGSRIESKNAVAAANHPIGTGEPRIEIEAHQKKEHKERRKEGGEEY